jgi:hypothetical protein
MSGQEAQESLEVTGQTALDVIQEHMGAGDVSSLMNLFSQRQANGASADAIQNEITAKVTSSLLSKNNFNLDKVLPIVTMVLPLVMNHISKKNDETPDDDDSPLRDMFGGAAGSVLAGTLGGALKNFFYNLNCNEMSVKAKYQKVLDLGEALEVKDGYVEEEGTLLKIGGTTKTQYKYKKQTGGRGQYGDVHIRIEPQPRGKGFEFVDEVTGGVIPAKFIPSVEKGVVEAMQEGPVSGSQVVDVKVAVFFGSYHTVDSSDQAFKMAGSMAFKQGFLQCDPVLLEPIYELEIVVPEDHTGDVMGDMSSRRGKIMGMEPKGKYQLVKAQAPLAELFKYSTSLRSMTGGRGRHAQKFDHYEVVPKEITDKIVEAYRASRSEDK